jgi:Domain of unknown function (DUF5658)
MTRKLLALLTVMTLMPATLRAADDKIGDEGVAAERATLSLFASPSLSTGRPMALPALYGTLAGLQIFDGYSTVTGLRRGATEANPIVGGLAGNPAAFWSLKAASTGVSIYFAERLWKRGRRGQAIAVMLASNAVMSAVAARNASVLKATR